MRQLGILPRTSNSFQPSHSYVDSLSPVRHNLLTLTLQGSCKFSPHSWSCRRIGFTLGGAKSSHSKFEFMHQQLPRSTKESLLHDLETVCDGSKSDSFLNVQTLWKFPIEKLYQEVVLVRFDSTILLDAESFDKFSIERTIFTIKYLYDAGAKVLLVSNWGKSTDDILLSEELLADRLSSLLQVKVMAAKSCTRTEVMKKLENANIILLGNLTKFRGEISNCLLFSETISSGVSLFVNDAFSVSHKILASTVGVVRFCHASVAGFHFEEQLHQLKKIIKTSRQPYIAIIGGGNFLEKADALYFLASRCDGLILLGNLAIQIMNALGIPVPAHLVECQAVDEVLRLIQLAEMRKIQIYFPKDVLCVNNNNPAQSEIFPSNDILTGWTPKDLGPTSLKEMSDILSTCKKALIIGSLNFDTSEIDVYAPSQLAFIFERISRSDCEVVLVGNAACKAVIRDVHSSVHYTMIRNASVVWDFMKGRKLPGVAALDRAYPYSLKWEAMFIDPSQPIVVDIGSGNGLFIFKMARKLKDYNFLGLEINKKLVNRCLKNLRQTDIRNSYFLSANATTTFRSIMSDYPGELVLVTIQCPNPDFNRETYRWRMVQKFLIEAIVDLLVTNGKVFLQSDIEAVATRMKDQFLMHGKGNLVVDGDGDGWLEENPLGARTDWECHVLERGDPMFRIMLRKV